MTKEKVNIEAVTRQTTKDFELTDEELNDKSFMRGLSKGLAMANISIEWIGLKPVYGKCEACLCYILKGDTCYNAGDGCILCAECGNDKELTEAPDHE